jgi:light-regulated signal transduction histidine kinase (bacteriophytochrome)
MDSFSKKLAEKYSDQLDSEGQWLIAVVRDGTRRMAQLINDIIAFSRIGRVALNTRIVSMAQLGQDVLLELDPIIGQRDVGLSIGTLPPAEGDAVTPRRVWMKPALERRKVHEHARQDSHPGRQHSHCCSGIVTTRLLSPQPQRWFCSICGCKE